jgi:S-formylglutathione hydrolase
MTKLIRDERHRCFEGWQEMYTHPSSTCDASMRFAIYLPPQAEQSKVPALYWLSGLTCSHKNFVEKAGAQRLAAELGLALVAPDTSPRDLGLPGEDDAYDFGSAAAYYVNATQPPWSQHYNTYDYVVKELPALIEANFPVDGGRKAISGHSVGGHGALVVGLKNPGTYRGISAFSPMVSATRCPWGRKAFQAYLGDDEAAWRAWDATYLVAEATGRAPALLVEQGEEDQFLDEQLKPHLLEEACEAAGHPLTLNRRPGYDHSYYFIASFIDEHLLYHARALGLA